MQVSQPTIGIILFGKAMKILIYIFLFKCKPVGENITRSVFFIDEVVFQHEVLFNVAEESNEHE